MLKLLFGLSLRTLRLPLVLSGLILLTSCGASPLSLLTGGGPNVAAPIAVGQTVEQTQGISFRNTTAAPSVSVRPNARVEKIDQSTTKNTTVDPWLIILLILGWLAPSPGEIGRWFQSLFRKGK